MNKTHLIMLWIGLGLNLVISLGGIAMFFGKMKQKVDDHQRRLDSIDGFEVISLEDCEKHQETVCKQMTEIKRSLEKSGEKASIQRVTMTKEITQNKEYLMTELRVISKHMGRVQQYMNISNGA